MGGIGLNGIDHYALRRGSLKVLGVHDDRQVFAFKRTLGEETLYIFINLERVAQASCL